MKTSTEVVITISRSSLILDMIAFHMERQSHHYNKSTRKGITQRESQADYWQSVTHREMKEFWGNVVIDEDS